ncbi:MAG: trypsin-like peptidase domain-containing protein [Phycisphaerales bacterium]|nr:trypsin-like peptidase domain-containing protein [Phycisphaerales bacterium]
MRTKPGWTLALTAAAALTLPASTTPAQDEAPAPSLDVVTFVDGREVRGRIIKETAEAIWLDLGFDVLKAPRTSVDAIVRADAEAEPEAAPSQSLYRVAAGSLPERSAREQAQRWGEAVALVSTPSGTGSGFVIHPDGYTITNAHVIQGETRVKCTLFERDGEGMRRVVIDDVEIIAVNNHLDLALVRLSRKDGRPFSTVYLAGSDELAAGQEVFAIGAPLGLERTLSSGVIATTLRDFQGVTYIQTTTQINPGNSGGPLFNLKGEVIGVTNMKIPFGEGLGFAIPARYVRDFLRNREAFAFDKNNPNSGHTYHDAPPRESFGVAPILHDEAER